MLQCLLDFFGISTGRFTFQSKYVINLFEIGISLELRVTNEDKFMNTFRQLDEGIVRVVSKSGKKSDESVMGQGRYARRKYRSKSHPSNLRKINWTSRDHRRCRYRSDTFMSRLTEFRKINQRIIFDKTNSLRVMSKTRCKLVRKFVFVPLLPRPGGH
jgi:hypothetical protein